MKIQNPIIRGFYPDPSICRAGKKYYLASSSFQYFPGVPLFESDDLLNWRQVGHCLTRDSQVALHQVPSSGGVFAPTLRYHEGRFYMVTNNNTYQKNFYVWTDDITGEWSEPVYVEQEGIDPSFLFDNGKVYFTSNGVDEEGIPCILQCEINIQTGERLTESKPVWRGSGGRYLESPHLYHIGDWYYLMVAEGGTEYGHMITYARAKEPFGPFEGYARNPVLTNRNLGGNQSLIQGIGHGDLIQSEGGEYYLVCLGFRQIEMWQAYHHLGREIFLAPVCWQEDGWFQAGEAGIVKEWTKVNFQTKQPSSDLYGASFETLGADHPRWCYLRDYHRENYEFIKEGLRLRGTEITLNQADTPTFIGIRQSEFDTRLKVTVAGTAQEAGVTFYMDERQHYDLALVREDGKQSVMLRLRIGDAECVINSIALPAACREAELEVISESVKYSFYCTCEKQRQFLGEAQSKYLSSEVAGGFTGVVMGMYAVDEEKNWAVFKDLEWEQGR